MPLQNRVTPYGELIATPAKGLFMGNRGILHNEAGELTVKRWAHKSWVTCALSFKDYKRSPRQRNPNEYTELFFLDEATALAAGHRPCRQCRYHDFVSFVDCWARGNGAPSDISVKVIDNKLHEQRVTRARAKVFWSTDIAELPNGVFVELLSLPGTAWLVRDGELLQWTPEGYGQSQKRPGSMIVKVLTPESTVNAIRAGYVPGIALGEQ